MHRRIYAYVPPSCCDVAVVLGQRRGPWGKPWELLGMRTVWGANQPESPSSNHNRPTAMVKLWSASTALWFNSWAVFIHTFDIDIFNFSFTRKFHAGTLLRQPQNLGSLFVFWWFFHARFSFFCARKIRSCFIPVEKKGNIIVELIYRILFLFDIVAQFSTWQQK